MCVKLPPEDLNLGRCPPKSTSIYTCRVIIASKECGGSLPIINIKFVSLFLFVVEYFIKTTQLQVCFYSLFLFLWFCL